MNYMKKIVLHEPKWSAIRKVTNWSTDRSYQYLQESDVPTFKFQKSLPHLSVPKLEDTCGRYLLSQKPLLSDQVYENTERLVKQFRDGVGKNLQKELMKKDQANKHTNYINEDWTSMYLKDRRPIVFNHTPFFTFTDDPRKEYNELSIKVSNILISSLRFAKSLRESILEPDVFHLYSKKSNTPFYRNSIRFSPEGIASYVSILQKAYPLDMSQYMNLFQSTRIPLQNKDKIMKFKDSRHMMVMKNGWFYIFDVFDENGNIYGPEYLNSCIKFIINDKRPINKDSIAVLTTENRDIWAKLREHLIALGNEEQLNLIDSAYFNIILDDWEEKSNDLEFKIRKFLCGEYWNRWFDKSISLLFSKDGQASTSFEHSWGDGVSVMRFFNEVSVDSKSKSYVRPGTDTSIDVSNHVRVLDFQLDETIEKGIMKARCKFENTLNSLSFRQVLCDNIGKDLCKKTKISPDSLMQTAFQIAYHRVHGNVCATYESCSTAAFKHGRTETIRPCTVQTKRISERFNSGDAGESELLDLLQSCSFTHGNLTKKAAMGQGWDRHFFALRKIVEKSGGEMPEIFSDPAFSAINHIILSTSTVSSPNVGIGGFCPVVPNGLGLGYGIIENDVGTVISAYKDHQDCNQFGDALLEVFKGLRDLLRKKSTIN